MTERICPVCSNFCFERLKKGAIPYFKCTNCQMLYCDPLPQEDKVGGGNEIPRNKEQNHLRIERLDILFKDRQKSDVHVLDFGCGTGYLVNDLQQAGYRSTGYDAYSEKFNRLPPKDTFEAITCVEVIEHCSFPFPEIEVMYRSLKRYGVVMFETSFTNVADQEGIEFEDFEYLNTEVGHCTLFSHHALDLLMVGRGFKVGRHFNRHVRIYYKA